MLEMVVHLVEQQAIHTTLLASIVQWPRMSRKKRWERKQEEQPEDNGTTEIILCVDLLLSWRGC